jgi:hypothetical protein
MGNRKMPAVNIMIHIKTPAYFLIMSLLYDLKERKTNTCDERGESSIYNR